MPKHIPFYPELLEEKATTNEILLYGLIDVLSFSQGYCYASSEYMASQLGIAAGTLKNLLSSLAKRGWIQVEVNGNKRVAIMPLLGLSIKKKSFPQTVTPELRSVEKSNKSVTQELRYRHATMTEPSRRNDARNRGVTGVGITSNNKYNKEVSALAKNEPSRTSNKDKPLLISKVGLDDAEYERQFYARNTITM